MSAQIDSEQPESDPQPSECAVPEPVTAAQPASEAYLLEWFTPEELAAEQASAEPAIATMAPPPAEADSAPAETPPEATAAKAPPIPVPAPAVPRWTPRVFAAPPSVAEEAAAQNAALALRWQPWLTEQLADAFAAGPLSTTELKAARVLSNLLALWALCEEPACRREGACRGTEPHCFGAVGHLVPASALPFLAGFVAGQLDRLPFHHAVARLPEGVVDAWEQWHGAVAQITGRPSYRVRGGERSPDGAKRNPGTVQR